MKNYIVNEIHTELQEIIIETNNKIEQLGIYTNDLSICLEQIQSVFDTIRRIPSEQKTHLKEVKQVRMDWIEQVHKIEQDFKSSEIMRTGAGAAGAGVGVAVLALGPTAAMGVATTFGVASTGTAIATLSGAAATNAALAWLGGGALAIGGGGIAAGNLLIFFTGPIGIGISIFALGSSGLASLKSRKNKSELNRVFDSIALRDVNSYRLSIIELEERIIRIKEETQILKDAIVDSKTYGNNYSDMTEPQQFNLISFVNLMNSSMQLLVNPILGLQTKYSDRDFEDYLNSSADKDLIISENLKPMIIYLANLLYKIELDDKDKKLIWKNTTKNSDLLKRMRVTKKEFGYNYMNIIEEALKCKYEKEV